MPLEEIRNLLDGAIDLPTALAQQKDRLKAEQERIQGAILFCEWIQERKLEELDVDNCVFVKSVLYRMISALHRNR